MSKIKILVAEDDLHIREGLTDALSLEGYDVREAADGSEALRHYTQWQPDLLLLDLMMPKLSGYDVCRQIRNGNSAIPIIMLTAKGEELDKVLGLELGADDYVTKPFSVRELLARVAAVLRRTRPAAPPDPGDTPATFVFGQTPINVQTMKAQTVRGEVELTAREIELLRYFTVHPDVVLDRYRILDAVWGAGYRGMSRTLDQHIAQLRKKVETDPAQPEFIETVYGIGYRYNPPKG